ncbi:8-amino-7-oxononanoate synthase, partial [Streptomyces sp. IgraMP-1]
AEPDRAARVRRTARTLYEELTAAGFQAARPDAAVVSVRAPSAQEAADWAARCREQGLAVGCFRPPSVPDGVSRLRLTARADLTPADLDRALSVLTRTAPPAAR